MSELVCDVAIVGAGPAGIAAATALKDAGVQNVMILEREPEAGGIPRHIHHPTFGLLVFHRPMSGPKFIARILSKCRNVQFEFNASVMEIKPEGILNIATPEGGKIVKAKHIVLATGARERPRHPRLISGLRPQGIMTTGALQKFIYGETLCPFKRPVIVGTELASFSALSTLKSGGAKAVAMIEENPRITAYRPAMCFAAIMGTPIHYNSRIVDIGGMNQVEYVRVKDKNGTRQIDCDGVIFSGGFVGETALSINSHLEHHPVSHLPLVDQNWVSSDPQISIIGNCVHPADMGDQCYMEGLEAGKHIANLIKNPRATTNQDLFHISHDSRIKMLTPSAVRIKDDDTGELTIHLHVRVPFWGKILIRQADQVLYSKTHRCLPARRITLKNVPISSHPRLNTESHFSPKIEIILGTA